MIYTLTLNPALDRELTIPSLSFDTVLRASESRADCGGKGFNVSRMLATLGAKSIALGFSGGHTGAMLRDGLADLGIETDFVWIEGETRTNVSIVMSDEQRHIKVNEAGPTISAAAQEALNVKIRSLLQPGDWWVLAGSLPPGVAATFYADLIHQIQAAGAFALLDTSGAALRHGCAARPLLVKPNSSEASELTGKPISSPDDAIAVANTLEGIEYVVISMGAAGALIVHEGEGWMAAPPPIHERNPIGAGDSLVAGLTWSLSEGRSAAEAIRWGVACGAAAASGAGTSFGNYEQIADLAAQVSISKI